MSICVVVGTRPEIIKLAPVIRALGPDAEVVHTGQHWDDRLADTFFRGAGLAPPTARLTGIGGTSRGRQIGAVTLQLTERFVAHRPDAVIVQGDTNSTSAGAQAASYAGIPVVHVEAGLRSHDRAMPEELNRLVVGALADLHCAATAHNVDNLLAEGVPARRIVLTGNTIVEATLAALATDVDAAAGPGRLGLDPGGYVLATIHRPENTDDPAALAAILGELARLPLPVVLPLHPRTAGLASAHGLSSALGALRVTEPVDHGTFLGWARHAALLVSDSGGVQEECTVLKKPLVVVRRSTERPEAIDAGFAHLVPAAGIGVVARGLLADPALGARLAATPSPYGDARAAARIVDATRALLGAPIACVA